MTRFASFVPAGVIPACLLPFDEDFAIDARAYRAHLRDVAAVPGLAAITTNAHSSEVHACSPDEQRQVLDLTMDEIGDRLPVVAGVYADGSLGAAEIAGMAERAGATALLVFPPNSMSMGGPSPPGDGARPFPPHCGRERPADHPLPVFAGERSGISAGDAARHCRGGAEPARDQGLEQRRDAA